MLRVSVITILARDMRFKVFDEALEMLRVPLVTILARNVRLKFVSTTVESGAIPASHGIRVRYAIEGF